MHARYQARLRRQSPWWAIDVPELAVFTQCRTLDQAEHAARLGIAAVFDVPLDAFVVDLVFPEAAPLLRPVVEARRQRAAAMAAEEQALADAVHRLMEELGVSQFDAGRILGLSQEDLSRLTPACPPIRAAGGGMYAGNGPAVPAASPQGVPDWPDVRGRLPRHAARPAWTPRRRPSWATEEQSGPSVER